MAAEPLWARGRHCERCGTVHFAAAPGEPARALTLPEFRAAVWEAGGHGDLAPRHPMAEPLERPSAPPVGCPVGGRREMRERPLMPVWHTPGRTLLGVSIVASARVRVVLAGLLMAGAVACTSGPKAPTAADTAVPKQVLPSVPQPPAPSQSSEFGGSSSAPSRSALARGEATADYIEGLRLSDTDHSMDRWSDADLLAAGDGACARMSMGRTVADAQQWLESQGYQTKHAVAVLTAGTAYLCRDQLQKFDDAVKAALQGG